MNHGKIAYTPQNQNTKDDRNGRRVSIKRAQRNLEKSSYTFFSTMTIFNVHNALSDERLAEPRPLLSGTPKQAADDLQKLEKLGIDHVFYDMNYPAAIPADTQLRLLGNLVELSG